MVWQKNDNKQMIVVGRSINFHHSQIYFDSHLLHNVKLIDSPRILLYSTSQRSTLSGLLPDMEKIPRLCCGCGQLKAYIKILCVTAFEPVVTPWGEPVIERSDENLDTLSSIGSRIIIILFFLNLKMIYGTALTGILHDMSKNICSVLCWISRW